MKPKLITEVELPQWITSIRWTDGIIMMSDDGHEIEAGCEDTWWLIISIINNTSKQVQSIIYCESVEKNGRCTNPNIEKNCTLNAKRRPLITEKIDVMEI